MTAHQPQVNAIDLVCADVDASVVFYRRLGLDIPDDAIWRAPGDAHHISIKSDTGFDLSLNSEALADAFNPRWRERGRGVGALVIGFDVDSREAVDERYADLTAAGYDGRREPHDAFWGSRYAIVADPDGNDVGIMSPPDAGHRTAPPEV